MNRRFVGGPHDGQWLDVWDNPSVYMPIPERAVYMRDEPLNPTEPRLKIAVYELVRYRTFQHDPLDHYAYRFVRIETR